MTQDKDEIRKLSAPQISHAKQRLSLIWLVPVVAVVIGLGMLLQSWLAEGPRLTITFATASGLEAGKTPVKYKDVDVGHVTAVTLSDDQSHVIVTVALVKNAAGLARQDSRFWVVRPRIGLSGVSGIDTLISGAYIGVDVGISEQTAKSFTGLETPPSVINGMPGTTYVVKADDLGSLGIGSPVYYRRIEVGRVSSYQLSGNGNNVDLQVFIDAPYDQFVTANTRFWNAGGIDISLSAEGLKLNTQSAASVLAGGIAFATPEGDSSPTADSGTVFMLAVDKDEAMKPKDGLAVPVELRFKQALRGLSIDAPVEFSGLNIGHVTSIDLDYDAETGHFPSVVNIEIYPNRLGSVLNKLPTHDGSSRTEAMQFFQTMVENGLRAQVRPGNLLTGQLYVALDFIPDAEKVNFDISADPLELPTVNDDFDRLQVQLTNIMNKVEKMPLDSIAINLNQNLVELEKTLQLVNSNLIPQLQTTLNSAGLAVDQVHEVLSDNSALQQNIGQTLQSFQQASEQIQGTFSLFDNMLIEDAPMQQNLTQTLQELQRAAKSLRTLTDMLGRNPEALIRGRTTDGADN